MNRWISRILLAVVLATLAGTSYAADPQKILSDGTVQRIRVEAWSPEGVKSGTVLRHVTQLAGGGVTVRTIPGTDDAAIESEHVFEVDPNDNSLVLVWVRNEAGIRELRISRFRNDAWGTPLPVVGAAPGASCPRLAVTRNWIHLIWTEPWGPIVRTPWRGVFRHADFGIAFGPEALPWDLAPASVGDAGGGPGPDRSQVYLSLYLPGWFPGSDGSVHVWGIRDEPVPIGYHQGHPLPSEVGDVQDLDAGWIGGSLTYWFHDPSRFVYRSYRDGAWGPFRMVLLDDQTPPEAARIQMVEMLRRR